MKDAYASEDGKVVIYDTVVSLASGKLMFIGPHKKLWIVPETPKLQVIQVPVIVIHLETSERRHAVQCRPRSLASRPSKY